MQDKPLTAGAGSVAAPPNATMTAYTIQVGASPQALPAAWYEKPWFPASVAAFVTLAGVLIGLWWKWRSEKHERRIAVKERIYLKMMQAVYDIPIHITSLGDVKTSFQNVQEKIGVSLADMAQAEIVARMPLIEAITDYRNFVMKRYFAVMAKRAKIEKNKLDIIDIEQKIAENNDLIAAIRKSYLTATSDDQIQRLGREWSNINGQKISSMAQRDVLNRQNGEAAFSITTDTQDMVKLVGSRRTKILKLIRKELKELGEKFDEKRYQSLQDATLQAASEATEQMIRDAQAAMNPASENVESPPPRPSAPPAPPKNPDPPANAGNH